MRRYVDCTGLAPKAALFLAVRGGSYKTLEELALLQALRAIDSLRHDDLRPVKEGFGRQETDWADFPGSRRETKNWKAHRSFQHR